MTDPTVDPNTPASPDSAPSQPHGDAFLDQSGSRQGLPPSEPATPPGSPASPEDEEDQPAGDAPAG